MKYATPTVGLIQFDQQDVMILSDLDHELEKGELGKPMPLSTWITEDLTIRDIEDI